MCTPYIVFSALSWSRWRWPVWCSNSKSTKKFQRPCPNFLFYLSSRKGHFDEYVRYKTFTRWNRSKLPGTEKISRRILAQEFFNISKPSVNRNFQFGSEAEVKYFEIIKDLAVGSLMKENSNSSYMSRIILVRGVFKLCSPSDWLKYRAPSLAQTQFEIPIEGKIFENQIGKWLLHYGPQYKGEVPLCIHQDIESLGNVNLIITNIFVLVVGVMFLRHFRHSQTLGKMVFSIFHCIKDRFILALESHRLNQEP